MRIVSVNSAFLHRNAVQSIRSIVGPIGENVKRTTTLDAKTPVLIKSSRGSPTALAH